VSHFWGLHKPTGQALVELNGQRIYLGRYESAEARQRNSQLVAEWLANGRALPVTLDQITVVEMIARFWTYAQDYYRTPDGEPSAALAADGI